MEPAGAKIAFNGSAAGHTGELQQVAQKNRSVNWVKNSTQSSLHLDERCAVRQNLAVNIVSKPIKPLEPTDPRDPKSNAQTSHGVHYEDEMDG
jgi:hypothetical protein